MRGVRLYLISCVMAAAVPLLSSGRSIEKKGDEFPGWPARFEGLPLKKLPLSRREASFEERFPGRIARFTDGRREIVIRWVSEGTRKLHRASSCFKGSGYAVHPLPIRIDRAGNRWGSFRATRGDEELLVLERIHDGEGNGWTDVSAWYWAALTGRSRGPWWAVTVAAKQK